VGLATGSNHKTTHSEQERRSRSAEWLENHDSLKSLQCPGRTELRGFPLPVVTLRKHLYGVVGGGRRSTALSLLMTACRRLLTSSSRHAADRHQGKWDSAIQEQGVRPLFFVDGSTQRLQTDGTCEGLAETRKLPLLVSPAWAAVNAARRDSQDSAHAGTILRSSERSWLGLV
jgi:hypothetical protein